MNRNIPSISKLNNLFLDKELKPSELFEQVYENASFTESILHAHLELFYDEGLENSKKSDERFLKGESLGKLDGIPIAIKDNINVYGYKTTCSSKMLSNYVSPYDATVIEMLKETGSTFTGKTNLDTVPYVGLKPTTPQNEAGCLIDPPVSLPKEATAEPAETTAADPPEEPPGT